MTPTVLKVSVGGDRLLGGALCAEVKQEESFWQISDGVLEVTLLKRSRRGNYANGHTNADTFWRCAPSHHVLMRLIGEAHVACHTCDCDACP